MTLPSPTLLFVLLLTGCHWLPSYRPHSPTLSVVTADGTIQSSGDTPTPPKVSTITTLTSLPLPLGQKFTFDSKTGLYDLTLSRDTQITTRTTDTKVEGPVSFPPPKGPSVAEVKAEDRKGWLYLAAFAGGVAGIFGLVRDWHLLMIGGFSVTGAAVAGIFLSSHPVITLLIAGGAGFAVAGPYAYHLLGHRPPTASAATPLP